MLLHAGIGEISIGAQAACLSENRRLDPWSLPDSTSRGEDRRGVSGEKGR